MRGFFVAYGLTGVFACELSGCHPLLEDCPKSTCSSEGTHCRDGKVLECALHEGDPCSYHTEYVVDDCPARGEACVEGRCEPPVPRERCPSGNGECRGNEARRCEGGYVEVQSCLEGTTCFEVPASLGHVQAVCAVVPEPCVEVSDSGSECQGNTRVLCDHGYPIVIEPCAGIDVACVEYESVPVVERAQCTLSVPCPLDGGRLCHDNVVHGCERSETTVRLRDCGPLGDHCVARGDRTFCSASSDAPAPPRFLPIPGGTFEVAGASVAVADFELQEKEVTFAEYETCRAAGACTELDAECHSYTRPNLHADLPVTCIDLSQARAYCAFVGGRLPTDAEWEYALRNGGDAMTLPWGSEPATCDRAIVALDETRLGCGRGEQWPGCSRAADVTEQGICDLVGNVEEWVELGMPSEPATRGFSFYTVGSNFTDELPPRRIGETTAIRVRGLRCAR